MKGITEANAGEVSKRNTEGILEEFHIFSVILIEMSEKPIDGILIIKAADIQK